MFGTLVLALYVGTRVLGLGGQGRGDDRPGRCVRALMCRDLLIDMNAFSPARTNGPYKYQVCRKQRDPCRPPSIKALLCIRLRYVHVLVPLIRALKPVFLLPLDMKGTSFNGALHVKLQGFICKRESPASGRVSERSHVCNPTMPTALLL